MSDECGNKGLLVIVMTTGLMIALFLVIGIMGVPMPKPVTNITETGGYSEKCSLSPVFPGMDPGRGKSLIRAYATEPGDYQLTVKTFSPSDSIKVRWAETYQWIRTYDKFGSAEIVPMTHDAFDEFSCTADRYSDCNVTISFVPHPDDRNVDWKLEFFRSGQGSGDIAIRKV